MDLFVTVKKSDGTQVRMTMEEFKLYKQGLQNKTNQSPVVQENNPPVVNTKESEKEKKLAEPPMVKVPDNKGDVVDKIVNGENNNIKQENKRELPAVVRDNSLTNIAPVKDIFLDEAAYQENQKSRKPEIKKNDVLEKVGEKKLKKNEWSKISAVSTWNESDHRSLLEEDDEEIKKNNLYTALPSNNDDLINKIISEIKFSFSDNILSRLQSLISSRIKDIRTDDQILDYATREQPAGGLGFSQSEAGELVNLIRQHVSTGRLQRNKMDNSKKDSLKEVVVASSAPNNNIFSPISKIGAGKPILQDVVLPEKQKPNIPDLLDQKVDNKKSVSPLDELRTFDLKDWRRLSNNPAKAGEKLLEKFMVLKKDSFISFIDAVTAWRQSPLYNIYENVIATCINNQEKVKDYLFNQDKTNNLSPEEFNELVKVNKNLV